jgi:predicted SprT family Zn-dependent metalloprotease
MNLDEIIERASFYTNLLWNKTLTCDIQINSRLKSTHGQFIHYDNGKELDKIELAKKLLNTEKFFIIDTLLHELTHWYLCSIGKDNRDGCKEFEDELIRIGVSSTETTRDRGNFGEFGWGYERLNSQSEKLEYLLTMAMSTEGRKLSAPEEFIETEGLKLLNDEIANYCNCDGIEIIGKMEADSWSYNGKTEHYISYDGYIDHQSVEGYSSLKDFLDKNDTTVVDYVFNSKVSMIIDNDNH